MIIIEINDQCRKLEHRINEKSPFVYLNFSGGRHNVSKTRNMLGSSKCYGEKGEIGHSQVWGFNSA